MATELITPSSRHLRSSALSPEAEDVSSGSNDVEMLLVVPEVKPSEAANASSGGGPPTNAVTPSGEDPGAGGENKTGPNGSGSPGTGVHHHHHYHYYYHIANSGSASPSTTHAPPITTTSTPPAAPKSRLLIPPSNGQTEVVSSSTSGATTPVTPHTPLSPISPPLSLQNTAALVRTISNGSTFGPINAPPESAPTSWPPAFGPSYSGQYPSVNHHHQSSTYRATARSTQTTPSPTAIHSIPNSPTVTAVTPTTQLTSSTFSQLTFTSSTSSSATISTVPSSRGHSVTTSLNGPKSNAKITTTTVTVQPFPVQPTLLYPADLPLVFGEKYILISQMEASNLYRCFDKETKQEYCCKVLLSKSYNDFLAPHFRMDGHEGINQVQKIIVGQSMTFILFNQAYGDLHSYVRTKRRIREPEAADLFKQVVTIVADCHANGIILRDLKLRKFIFSDKEKTQLKLECLEGAALCEDGDDTLTDKHGCPAYVSPEILNCDTYSGMIADCWSLGVILYTMLTGRYPFHDASPGVVFLKIRRGTFFMPDFLSKNAKCLIRSLIRLDPEQRLTSADTLSHRWFKTVRTHGPGYPAKRSNSLAGTTTTSSAGASTTPAQQSLTSVAAAAVAAISHHHHYHHHHHAQSRPAASDVHFHTTINTAIPPSRDWPVNLSQAAPGGHVSLPGTPLLTTITNPPLAPSVMPTVANTIGVNVVGGSSGTSAPPPSYPQSQTSSTNNTAYRDDGMDLMPTRVMTRGPVIGPRMGPNHPVGGSQTPANLQRQLNSLLSTFGATLVHPLSNTTFPLRNPPVHNHDPFTTCTFYCFHAPTTSTDQIVPDLSMEEDEEAKSIALADL